MPSSDSEYLRKNGLIYYSLYPRHANFVLSLWRALDALPVRHLCISLPAVLPRRCHSTTMNRVVKHARDRQPCQFCARCSFVSQ